MYFHTDSGSARYFLSEVARLADENDQRLRIDVDDEGNLRIKRGEGVWSAPFPSTPDPLQDHPSVKGMRWFINEDGNVYCYPAEYQREAYPGDDHFPYSTEAAALRGAEYKRPS